MLKYSGFDKQRKDRQGKRERRYIYNVKIYASTLFKFKFVRIIYR